MLIFSNPISFNKKLTDVFLNTDLRKAALRGDILAQWRLSRRIERENLAEFKGGSNDVSKDFDPTKPTLFDQLSFQLQCGERARSHFNNTFPTAFCPHSFVFDKWSPTTNQSCKAMPVQKISEPDSNLQVSTLQ